MELPSFQRFFDEKIETKAPGGHEYRDVLKFLYCIMLHKYCFKQIHVREQKQGVNLNVRESGLKFIRLLRLCLRLNLYLISLVG